MCQQETEIAASGMSLDGLRAHGETERACNGPNGHVCRNAQMTDRPKKPKEQTSMAKSSLSMFRARLSDRPRHLAGVLDPRVFLGRTQQLF